MRICVFNISVSMSTGNVCVCIYVCVYVSVPCLCLHLCLHLFLYLCLCPCLGLFLCLFVRLWVQYVSIFCVVSLFFIAGLKLKTDEAKTALKSYKATSAGLV